MGLGNSMGLSLENKKLNGLDHLRAFAIIFVFLFHYKHFGHPAWEEGISKFGWTGVDLFFVLSGYLIAGQLFGTLAKGKSISLKTFFIKRFFRIIPPYFLILTLYATFPFLREREQLAPIWKYLTFTLNFGLDLSIIGTFSHAWSLCIEEQFYLVLPITILFFKFLNIGKKAWMLILALFIGCFFVRAWSYYELVVPFKSSDQFTTLWYEYIYYPTYCRLDGLLVGVSIAGLFAFNPELKEKFNKYSDVFFVTGVFLLIGSYFICEDYYSFEATLFGFPLISFAYGLIIIAVVCPACFLYKLKSKVTSVIASLSYSLYLVHKMTIHITQTVFEKMGMDKNGTLMFLLCIFTSLIGALIINFCVEKPSFKLRNIVLKSARK